MDLDYLSRVLTRLRPFVREGVIRRTRLERVLGTLQTPADVIRPEVERVLAKAKIRIEEDAARELPAAVAVVPEPPLQDPPGSDTTDRASITEARKPVPLDSIELQLALKAARTRIAADRYVSNHASILLTAQQEVGLAILIRGREGQALAQGAFASLTGEARKAAECLFLHNQRLVYSVAKVYPQAGMSYDDLAQHGMTGLIRAIELFDPTQGNKFSTYAMWWIRQSISRGIANESRLIRLPAYMVERLNKVWAVRARLTLSNEPPTLCQLARACELDEKQVLECLRLGPPVLASLDMPIGDGEATLGDVLDRADPELDPANQVEYLLLQEELGNILDMLSEREAGVISMRFGLTTGERMTLDDIGEVYGVTRERIRQIESKTLDKLKDPSFSEVLEPFFYGGGRRPRPKAPEEEIEVEVDLVPAEG